MSVYYDIVYEPAFLPSTVGTQYEAPAGTRVLIKKITCFNSDTSLRTVTLHLVPASGGAAGTAADSNMLIKQRAILPGQTIMILEAENHVLVEHDSIQAFASVASKVSMRVSGVKQ